MNFYSSFLSNALSKHRPFEAVINSFVRNGVVLTTVAAIKSLRSADPVSRLTWLVLGLPVTCVRDFPELSERLT